LRMIAGMLLFSFVRNSARLTFRRLNKASCLREFGS
jgi:hypothetical protein